MNIQKLKSTPDNGITVIITVWKRPYLSRQIESLINQTLQPKGIWIVHNENYIQIRDVVDTFLKRYPNIFIIDSDLNLKYFGRFSLCHMVDTPYVQVIDDDVIPGVEWLQTCVEKCLEYQAVVSCSGRLIRPGNFRPEEILPTDDMQKTHMNYFIGDCYNNLKYNYSPADSYVDYGCNSYFFKTEWISSFWSVWPFTFDSGEDIHLSATLKIVRDIPTVVPKQTSIKTTGNLRKEFSADQFSSWLKDDFIDIREKVLKFFILNKNWNPILWKKSTEQRPSETVKNVTG